MNNIDIYVDKGAKFILDTLNLSGYSAFVVGGCVRDSIMRRTPNDWDITTDAEPEDIIRIFKKTLPTGIKHGTVTVFVKKQGYEVTTFRLDGEYKDSRHPSSVEFTHDVREDLSRRDFTINAMAYSHRDGIIDCFGGVDDISNKIIKCVGSPKKRFEEDALRILRAIRFSAKLGFSIDDDTIRGMIDARDGLKNISFERICSEFEETVFFDMKTLDFYNRIGFLEMLFSDIFGEGVYFDVDSLSQYEEYLYKNISVSGLDVSNECNKVTYRKTSLVDSSGLDDNGYESSNESDMHPYEDISVPDIGVPNKCSESSINLTASDIEDIDSYIGHIKRAIVIFSISNGDVRLLRDESQIDDLVERFLSRMRYSKEQKKITKTILREMIISDNNKLYTTGCIVNMGDVDNFEMMKKADIHSEDISNDGTYFDTSDNGVVFENIRLLKGVLRRTGSKNMAKSAILAKFITKFQNPRVIFHQIDDIIISGECFSLSQLKINGKVLISEFGIKGPKIGEALEYLLDCVIDSPECNERERLIEIIKKSVFMEV